MYLKRSLSMPLVTDTPAKFRELHRHLFQDVYDWAGKYRTSDLVVDGRTGVAPERVPLAITERFHQLEAMDGLRNLSADRFANAAATHIAGLQEILPFRHGNQQVTLLHMAHLARNAGHDFELSRIDHDLWTRASAKAAVNDERLMSHAIATLFPEVRTMTPDQARREVLELRAPALGEISDRIDALQAAVKTGAGGGLVTRELRGLREEKSALENDRQVGAILQRIDQAQKAGAAEFQVLPGRNGSAQDAVYAIGRAVTRATELAEDLRAAHTREADISSGQLRFDRASLKLSGPERGADARAETRSSGPRVG
ncbi:cell filamentation cAMP-inducing protein Fic [Acetobacter nitrogenifigens DSM 23921 = NBRC 105050]|nr:cell filamentation cAMP-inducing protein Fic [Acetobacter nitrogenifigens DSM 23921 = NBRC 105050]